jgi:hypothetical protein
MEFLYLLCPLSMVAMMGWWAWSMRRTGQQSSCHAPRRSAADEAELTRMRAQLDQLEAGAREVSTGRVT